MKARAILQRHIFLLGAVLLTASGIPGAFAQSMTPLTGQLLQQPATAVPNPPAATPVSSYTPAVAQAVTASTPAAAAPATSRTEADPEPRILVGDVTRTLLQAQADGRVAGPRLPMLGATADASWQRYLDSFKHPLPEHFENAVPKSTSN